MEAIKPNEAATGAAKDIISLVRAGTLDTKQYAEPLNRLFHESFKQGYNHCITKLKEHAEEHRREQEEE